MATYRTPDISKMDLVLPPGHSDEELVEAIMDRLKRGQIHLTQDPVGQVILGSGLYFTQSGAVFAHAPDTDT